ncbi:MAG: elongation factor G [Anaerolineae bacterium]
MRRLEATRNIGIIAHIDAGKTTVTERILYHTGRIHRMGNVDEGTTVTDFMPQERERGITIQSAAVSCAWRGHSITIIDTPGHIDFTAEVQRSLRVLDGGVVVFDGVAGVEPQSETVWHQADRYAVPRICFVNKLDRTGADFWHVVRMIEARLRPTPVAVQVPIGMEKDFRGVVDLVTERAYLFEGNGEGQGEARSIPPELADEVSRRREEMIERLADVDDEVAERYLEGEDLSPEFLRAALRKATLERRLVPVLCGSALRNKGIPLLLDAVVDYLPAPHEVAAVRGRHLVTGEEVTCPVDPDASLAALAFKVNTDPYIGRLLYVRVYAGVLRRGDLVLNATTGKEERIGRLVRMYADRREEVESLPAGDIGAVLGAREVSTGHTLCGPERPVALENIQFPQPVLSLSVQPRSRADQDRLMEALQKLTEEDPTLHLRQDPRTGETLLAGMGELHLDVAVDRLRREFGVTALVSPPRVAYCETITRPARAEGRLAKQTGGRGQFAHVVLELEPLPEGSGVVFEEALRGQAVPRQFVPAIEAGVRDALERGVLSGNPVVDVKVVLVDGKAHEVDSSDQAFHTAAGLAVREGVRRGAPILLEPVMRVDVQVPSEFLGDVLSDLMARGGQVSGTEPRNGTLQDVQAQVTLASMFGYATALRSLTQGRGTFSMEFHRYAPVPEKVAQELLRRGEK